METGVVCSHTIVIDDRVILATFIARLISFELSPMFLEHNRKLTGRKSSVSPHEI